MAGNKDNTIEVRWHGRGGQGAKSASVILAEVLFEEGKHVQAFPEYGAERQGAPIRAYNRVSDAPIRNRSSVRRPHIVVVLDATMIETGNLTDGCSDTSYLINTTDEPATLRHRLGLDDNSRVIALDATRIAIEELGVNKPNAPILGALSHMFPDVPATAFADSFVKKMSQLPEKTLEANRRAIMRGSKEVTAA